MRVLCGVRKRSSHFLLSTLNYGHKLWAVTARMSLEIQAAEMRFLCRVAELSLCDKGRSSVIQENLCIELLLLYIEGNRLRLFGILAQKLPEYLLLGEVFRKLTGGPGAYILWAN